MGSHTAMSKSCWPSVASGSITSPYPVVAGVLSNTGSVPARCIYDFSPLFPRLSWNGGLSWTDSESGRTARVKDWRLAALFELGRRLHDRGFNGRFRDFEPVGSG